MRFDDPVRLPHRICLCFLQVGAEIVPVRRIHKTLSNIALFSITPLFLLPYLSRSITVLAALSTVASCCHPKLKHHLKSLTGLMCAQRTPSTCRQPCIPGIHQKVQQPPSEPAKPCRKHTEAEIIQHWSHQTLFFSRQKSF